MYVYMCMHVHVHSCDLHVHVHVQGDEFQVHLNVVVCMKFRNSEGSYVLASLLTAVQVHVLHYSYCQFERGEDSSQVRGDSHLPLPRKALTIMHAHTVCVKKNFP